MPSTALNQRRSFCSCDTKENNWWDAAVLFRHKGSVLLRLVNAEDAEKVVCTERLDVTEGTSFVALGSKLYAFGPGTSYYFCDLGSGIGKNRDIYMFQKAGELCSAKPYPIVIPYANRKIFIIGTGSPYELMEGGEVANPHQLCEVLDVHTNVVRPMSEKPPFVEKYVRGSICPFSRGYTVVGNIAYVNVFAYSDRKKKNTNNPPYCLDMVTESWYPHRERPDFDYVFDVYDNWLKLGEVCRTKLFKVEPGSSNSHRPICVKVLDLMIPKPAGGIPDDENVVDSDGFQPLEYLNCDVNDAVEYGFVKDGCVLPVDNVHGDDLFCLLVLYYDMKWSLNLLLYKFRLVELSKSATNPNSPVFGCRILSKAVYQDFGPQGSLPQLLMTSGGYSICN